MIKKIGIIKIIGIGFLIVGLALVFFHKYPNNWIFTNLIHEFYANISSEFISIAITILLIDYLYEVKEKKSLKLRLIMELGSEEKGISSRALKEIKLNGWLTDETLNKVDLRKANLSNLDFEGANFEGAILDGANFTNSNLKNVNFKNASLNNVDLMEANLESADINNTTFHSANLYSVIMNKVNVTNVDFMNSNMEFGEMNDCHFINCKFEDVNLKLSNLSRSTFSNCNLLRVDMNSANIKNAKFERCDLNSLKNWKEIVNRSSESFLAPQNPPQDFINFNTTDNE